jgi:TP901 family phage tail tape measure protein
LASTNLEVVISARDQFTGTANRVIGTLHRMDGAAGRVGKGVGQLGLGLGKAGLIAAGAFATGIGAAAKAGMDFEDAFAGVRKTVEGTKPQLDGLGLELRALATRIPVKATDLAALAQEAGALGVPRAEVAKFTEVVSKLSAATTGLSTDVAAEAFGKLGNVLRVHGDDYARMASSLVALGNAGASSEADIIETAKRFGAAGAQAKLSAAQVLGFASAIASLGVEPEAAGSSLSRLFNNITKYIGTGNDKIEAFAQTAGLSVKAFSKLFADDASGAVQLFLKNLAKLDRFQAAAVLKDAGINNVRDINAVLLLSQNYGELKRQVDLSTEAFAKNSALEEAAALRFDTFRSKFTLLKNSLTEAGLEVAEGLLPALGRAIDKFRTFLALDTTKSSLRSLGKDIGDAIDRIDWRSLIDSAKTVWDVFKPFAQAVTALPNEIKLAVAGMLALNKASGGLVGAGLGNIIGGLGGAAAKGVAAKLPGVGAVFAQPVFVTNWPLGGLGGVPGAVGGAAGVMGILTGRPQDRPAGRDRAGLRPVPRRLGARPREPDARADRPAPRRPAPRAQPVRFECSPRRAAREPSVGRRGPSGRGLRG